MSKLVGAGIELGEGEPALLAVDREMARIGRREDIGTPFEEMLETLPGLPARAVVDAVAEQDRCAFNHGTSSSRLSARGLAVRHAARRPVDVARVSVCIALSPVSRIPAQYILVVSCFQNGWFSMGSAQLALSYGQQKAPRPTDQELEMTFHQKKMHNTSIFLTRESEARGYSRSFDVVFKSAKGATMTGEDGREYIDFLAGCASLNYGHNDPDMKRALIKHIEEDGLAQGLDLFTTSKRAFLRTFERLILEPRDLDYKVQFCGPTGTNAVEAAMKLARKVTKRSNIISFTNGYHGVSLGALAATGNKKNRVGPEQPLAGVQRAAFDKYFGEGIDTAMMLEKMLSDPSSGIDAPAAILFECVQGEGGLNAASAEWVQAIAATAKKHGALLIVDEIQTGCGRTGTFFSFESLGVVPDLVTLSKSISGYGLPMALLLIRPEYDIWKPAEHNGTFRGNNHAFVTARVALEKFWSDDKFANEIAAKAAFVHAASAATSPPSSRVPASRAAA